MKTQKASCSTEPFTIEWSDFFTTFGIDVNAKPITSSVWVLSEGATGVEFVNGTQTTVFINGGTVGTPMTLENTIEINSGEYKDCRTIYIEVFK